MDAGLFDRRVTIRRATTTRDETNQPVEAWADLATVWANAKPVADGERLRAGETLGNKAYRFTIRYSTTVAAVDPLDRVVFDGRTYDVNGVKELGRREYLEITATARAETP
jgi:SPP1 family predicted phage head-tail adaptor